MIIAILLILAKLIKHSGLLNKTSTFLKQTSTTMRKISTWAYQNKWKARITMTIAWLMLLALAIFIGTTLRELQFVIPAFVFLIITLIFLITVIRYPFMDEKAHYSATAFYNKRKLCDFILACCSFLMFLVVANEPAILFRSNNDLNAATPASRPSTRDSSARTYQSVQSFTASMKDENGKMLKWKERKKMLRKQIKAIKASSDKSDGEKTALVIVSVLVALGLLSLVASLACNLSCNGAEGAATLVAVGGTALIAILLILVIRGIYGRKKKRIAAAAVDQPAGQ